MKAAFTDLRSQLSLAQSASFTLRTNTRTVINFYHIQAVIAGPRQIAQNSFILKSHLRGAWARRAVYPDMRRYYALDLFNMNFIWI
jgi:hypothetical protein